MKVETTSAAAKPFLKWVGGKGRLLPQLLPLTPPQFKNYYEPFLGGGAFYFGLPGVKKAYLNDINQHLIAAYAHIRDDIEVIINGLKRLEDAYHKLDDDAQKVFFLERRAEYNALKDSNVRKTTLLIFLNKTCFNGMYRENRGGDFNVPFGKHRNPTICDENNLRNVSKKLSSAAFSSGSYKTVLKSAKKGDFVYFDPPYHPLNVTSSFTSYHQDGFSAKDQEALRDLFVVLDRRGCYVMLSNSNASFIKELYKDFRQVSVYASRSINAVGSKRGKIAELVVLNY